MANRITFRGVMRNTPLADRHINTAKKRIALMIISIDQSIKPTRICPLYFSYSSTVLIFSRNLRTLGRLFLSYFLVLCSFLRNSNSFIGSFKKSSYLNTKVVTWNCTRSSSLQWKYAPIDTIQPINPHYFLSTNTFILKI